MAVAQYTAIFVFGRMKNEIIQEPDIIIYDSCIAFTTVNRLRRTA